MAKKDKGTDVLYKDINKRYRGKRRSTGRKALLIFGVLLLLLLIAYFAVAMYFSGHFLYGTKINGVDFSFKNADQVEEYMKRQVAEYTLTLKEAGGSEEVIRGADIDIQYASGAKLRKLLEGQQNFFWIRSLWKPSEIETKIGVTYDAEEFQTVLSGLRCMDEEQQTTSKNAYPAFKDTKFEIVPEVIGTKVDGEKFVAAVEEAVNGFQETLDMQKAGCYILPQYVSDSPEVIEAADKMNSYLGAVITYEFGENREVVDASMISKWVTVKKKKMQVSFDEKSVKEYLKSLASKYDTRYRAKEFTTARGDTVTVEGGSYGWQIDQEGEYKHLIKDIKKAKVVSRQPECSSKAAAYGNAGVGNTYAEVDLTNQHMYFIKDGKVALESDVVTGNPNKGNATPQGVYTLSYKTKDAVLRGQKKPDGTYSYETPVKYWMPFNGGIGFHDATWQSSFGGDRYKSHGSHGCINMPKEKAAKLYDLISAGIPVICYF